MLNGFLFQLRNKMYSCFVFVLLQVAINTVVTRIDFAAFKPFPARCVAGIQHLVPVFVPGQHLGKLSITFRKVIETESFENRFLRKVSLAYEGGRWDEIALFLPMYRNF